MHAQQARVRLRVTSWFSGCPDSKESGRNQVCVACRFSDLNLPPKNWTFPCTVATLGEIKVWSWLIICVKLSLAGHAAAMSCD